MMMKDETKKEINRHSGNKNQICRSGNNISKLSTNYNYLGLIL